MTHPGVGPITALATEMFLGDPMRFADGKALASYVGMIPSEHSSGRRQRLGAMSKQGNRAAALSVVRSGEACGRAGSGVEAFLSAQTGAEGTGEGESRSRHESWESDSGS